MVIDLMCSYVLEPAGMLARMSRQGPDASTGFGRCPIRGAAILTLVVRLLDNQSWIEHMFSFPIGLGRRGINGR